MYECKAKETRKAWDKQWFMHVKATVPIDVDEGDCHNKLSALMSLTSLWQRVIQQIVQRWF